MGFLHTLDSKVPRFLNDGVPEKNEFSFFELAKLSPSMVMTSFPRVEYATAGILVVESTPALKRSVIE